MRRLLLVLPLILCFASAGKAQTNITTCQTLSSANTTYVLQNDVSAAGTCFTITANGVTLNLNGHTATYNTGNQTTPVSDILFTGNNTGFTIFGGSLTQGAGTSVAGSHVINMATPISGPTVHNITFTWSSDYSQAVSALYSNAPIAGGALIFSNTFNNNSAANCTNVGCRSQLQGASIIVLDAVATTVPAQIYSNTINGGYQGAIACNAPGCIIHDNILNPGNATVASSNDFAIWCWTSCNAYNNTIMTPLTGSSQGRGIQISAVAGSTNGANVHNNTVNTIEKSNNGEYAGCELGGGYGIQFDDIPTGATAQSNTVAAVADSCWATGLRLTDTETTTNISQNNTYTVTRKTAGSPACTFTAATSSITGCAHAVGMDGPIGFTSTNDSFQGDSDIFYFDWDGASGVTFTSPHLLKGTTNPSPDFHTFVTRNGGTAVSNVHVQDATFGTGTSATDTDIPAQDVNHKAVSIFIDWSQTVTVSKTNGTAAVGATVTFTDRLANTFSGTTNSSGVATIVVTQYRLNNDSGANGVENRNPFTRTITLAGCTTNTASGLTISATASTPVTLAGCASATDIYYSQTATGTGSSCASTKALPIVAGDWVAGNTIHLCGTITFPVGTTGIPIVGRNGTSGSPITLLGEPGVILQSPRFSGCLDGPAAGTGPAAEGGAIDISATSSFIIIDGGTNGIIQNTANGTGLANSACSLGIWAGGDNIIVRNWTVKNIYNRIRGTTTGSGGSTGDIMVTGGATSIKVCNNTFSNGSLGAELNFHTTPLTPGITSWTNPASCQSNTFTSGAVFANNTLNDHNWQTHINGTGAPVIINNEFFDWSNWQGDSADFHQDGFFVVGNSAATFKPYFINNYPHGDQNQGSPSGMWLFTDDGVASSGLGASSVLVGNIVYGTGSGITCCQGVGIQAVATGNPKGPYQFYNNTFINFAFQIENFQWVIASPTVDNRNNIWLAQNAAWFYNNQNTGWAFNTATINGNSYFGGRAPGAPNGPFGLWASNVDYSHWLTACVAGSPVGAPCDTNSSNSDPLLSGESSFATGGALTPTGFIPAANSPAANLGDNLSSQCASIPNQCASMPQTVGAGGSCGTGCIARPASGRWTAGAFQLTSGSVAPNPPTGLAATVSGSTVSLSWTASTGTPAPTAYTEYRGTVHGGPYTAIQSGITSTSTTDTPANGTYFYVIAAYIGGIVSSISGNGITATVTCTTTCAFPTGAVFTIGGDSQAAFNGTFTSTGQPTGSTFTFASSTNANGTGGGAWQSGAESAKSNEVTVTTPATLTASFLHASLVFANQIVGTSSASQSNTFTNTSAPGGTVTISSKSITGANAADFSFTDNCPSLLLSSVSCNFNVTFTPTAPGARVASLNVFDNASGSPQTVALSGTGVAQTPIVTLNPTSLNFGDQTLSTTSSVRSIILTNSGSGTLNITSVVASGDFAVVTVPVTNCGGTLAPLATCSLNVTFTPTATGGRVGAVTVTDNAAGSPHVANLSGNGITTKCAITGNVTLSGFGSVCQ